LSNILEISGRIGAVPVLVIRKRYRGIKWLKLDDRGKDETDLKALS